MISCFKCSECSKLLWLFAMLHQLQASTAKKATFKRAAEQLAAPACPVGSVAAAQGMAGFRYERSLDLGVVQQSEMPVLKKVDKPEPLDLDHSQHRPDALDLDPFQGIDLMSMTAKQMRTWCRDHNIPCSSKATKQILRSAKFN